jgi:hypothetical protein
MQNALLGAVQYDSVGCGSMLFSPVQDVPVLPICSHLWPDVRGGAPGVQTGRQPASATERGGHAGQRRLRLGTQPAHRETTRRRCPDLFRRIAVGQAARRVASGCSDAAAGTSRWGRAAGAAADRLVEEAQGGVPAEWLLQQDRGPQGTNPLLQWQCRVPLLACKGHDAHSLTLTMWAPLLDFITPRLSWPTPKSPLLTGKASGRP